MTADAARPRATLLDLDPAPWREIEVPLSTSLQGLHDSLQAAFLRGHAHRFESRVDDERHGIPDPFMAGMGGPKVAKAPVARLRSILKPGRRPFLHVYGFGDDRHRRVELLDLFEVEAEALLPRSIAGAQRPEPSRAGDVRNADRGRVRRGRHRPGLDRDRAGPDGTRPDPPQGLNRALERVEAEGVSEVLDGVPGRFRVPRQLLALSAEKSITRRKAVTPLPSIARLPNKNALPMALRPNARRGGPASACAKASAESDPSITVQSTTTSCEAAAPHST